MRVSAAPFAGHASGRPPAAAHVRGGELRGGHLGHTAKADDLQLKVYVGADDIYLCPAGERLSYRNTNEEDGKTLRRYWTRRIDGSDPRVRRAPADLVAPANNKRPRFYTTWVIPRRLGHIRLSGISRNAGLPLSGIACAMISEDFAPF